MRRQAPPSRSGSKADDIKKDLSPEQLQGIGAIAMAWNEVEFMLDCALYSGLILSGTTWLEVLTRLSTDAKIDLMASAEESLRLPANFRSVIQTTVRNIRELKELRNSIVHARIFDSSTGTGENIRRGGKIWQVLLVEPALNCLYERLVVLRGELRSVLAIFDLVRSGTFAVHKGTLTWEQLLDGKEVTDEMDRLSQRQSEQAALVKAMPVFKN